MVAFLKRVWSQRDFEIKRLLVLLSYGVFTLFLLMRPYHDYESMPSNIGWVISFAMMEAPQLLWVWLILHTMMKQKNEDGFNIAITTGYLISLFLAPFAFSFKILGLCATHCISTNSACGDKPIHDGLTALYFSAITLTTVGYGDYIPANTAGRAFAAVEAISGYVLFALIISTISAVILNKKSD